VVLQQNRKAAEEAARRAAQTDDAYQELLAEGMRYGNQGNTRRAARAFREAIALRPDKPTAYFNLGVALNNSGHHVEAAQRYLEAKERYRVGSKSWAQATARAFVSLSLAHEACAEVAKPEWWSDEGLKALSARVVRAAPDDRYANQMRALVLNGQNRTWEAGSRSAAELKKAAAHFERAAVLSPAPAVKAILAANAATCRSLAESLAYE